MRNVPNGYAEQNGIKFGIDPNNSALINNLEAWKLAVDLYCKEYEKKPQLIIKRYRLLDQWCPWCGRAGCQGE